MTVKNKDLKCTYSKKGCLTPGPGCTIDQMKNCGTAILWSSTDDQKCPALNFKDNCDIPDMRRLIISDAGKCFDGQCLRRLYPEIQEQISRHPNLQIMAKSIQQRRLQNKQGLILAPKQCTFGIDDSTAEKQQDLGL
jgi:hypothetical protein